MRTPFLKRTSGLVVAASLALATCATAGGLEGLAPPGPCAEPREALAGNGQPGGSAAILGSIQTLFTPSAVAAAPGAPTRPAPTAGGAPSRYPGACETGGSACQVAQRAAPADGNPPIVPGTRPGGSSYGYPGMPPAPPNPAIVPGTRP